MKLLFFLLSLLSLTVFGQGHSHQLKGKFTLNSSANTPVEFSLIWTEELGKITGTYKDNNFAQYAEVGGASEDSGRQFKVVLPEENKGVGSITILTSNFKPDKTGVEVPMAVILRDKNGNPLTTRGTRATYTGLSKSTATLLTQREEERPRVCVERMGELEGYCGQYGGLITEEVDATNSCNLLLADDIALDLDSERNLRLYLSSTDPLMNPPTHLLRRLPPNPKRSIDVSVRSCGTLPGVAFASNPMSCKKLNIVGDFQIRREKKTFTGTYTIFDERTRRFCRYGLSLEVE